MSDLPTIVRSVDGETIRSEDLRHSGVAIGQRGSPRTSDMIPSAGNNNVSAYTLYGEHGSGRSLPERVQSDVDPMALAKTSCNWNLTAVAERDRMHVDIQLKKGWK
ncbi:uncharacterized protein BDV17DRAFT_262862 [Aspergillus undulatus]|uniref:uncharacterized protein n=1 Tax=Aspergillus undulatus TaxID=1810928 RepID=UPI003CCE1BA3